MVVRDIHLFRRAEGQVWRVLSDVFERETQGQERTAAVGSSAVPPPGTNTAKASKGHGGSAQPIRR